MQDHLLPHPHPRDVLLVHIGGDPQRYAAGEVEHRLTRGDELTDLTVAADDTPIGGCRERHEAALRLGASQHGLGCIQVGTGLVHIDGSHDLVLHQFLHTLEIQTRQACPRVELLHGVGQVGIIKPGQCLPLAHLIALIDMQLNQIPRRS